MDVRGRSASWDTFRVQPITATLGYQEASIGRIRLDLLPQAVNVGFQRMGRHRRVVAPHLIQQHLPSNRSRSGPIEEFEDRRLFFRQADAAILAGSCNNFAAGRKV